MFPKLIVELNIIFLNYCNVFQIQFEFNGVPKNHCRFPGSWATSLKRLKTSDSRQAENERCVSRTFLVAGLLKPVATSDL